MPILRMVQGSVLCAILAIAPVKADAQSVARPDWKIGDTWTVAIMASSAIAGANRREEVRVVKEAGETGYKVDNTVKGGGTPAAAPEVLNLSRDLNFIGPSGAGGAPQEFKWLQWPLETGRSYEFETAAGNATAIWKGKVTGWEDVEVQAGKFKALHVEFDRSGPFRQSASESIWYAPEAKAVVKRIQTRPGVRGAADVTTYELVAYKLN